MACTLSQLFKWIQYRLDDSTIQSFLYLGLEMKATSKVTTRSHVVRFWIQKALLKRNNDAILWSVMRVISIRKQHCHGSFLGA